MKVFKSPKLRANAKRAILCGLLLVFQSGLFAHAKEIDEDEETVSPSEETLEEKFIRANIAISDWFNEVAHKIDLYLAGRQLTNRPNETSLRIQSLTTVREGEAVQNLPSISVNLRLPNLEEYWQLKFTSYDERRERREVQREYLRQTPRESSYGATLAWFRNLGAVRMSFEPRLELQDPLKVSHALTFESTGRNEGYEYTPKLQFFANPTQGVGVFTGINIFTELSRYYNLTLIAQGEYEEKSHLFTVTSGFSIGQPLTDRTSLSYSVFTSSNNQPNYHLEGYTVSASWNELIYKRILDYQITPHVDFPRDRNFKGIPGISLTITLNF